VIDQVAYWLLRCVVLFLDANREKHPSRIDKWLHVAAGVSYCGKICLSDQQRKGGWRTGRDDAGYEYAYCQEDEASL
jgi:hypothetical protein